MDDIDGLLKRWQTAGVLEAETAAQIRTHEAERAGGGAADEGPMGWQAKLALILGAILLACGVVLFVAAHWDELGPGWRFALAMGMVAVFHLGGGAVRREFHALSTALHGVGTIATGAAIALVGQIFNIQEHWPAAVLLWAVAAGAGWLLLRDEAQETLTLLLAPAWMVCEFAYAADGHIGADVYVGRMLMAWAVLYLTIFLGSKHRIAQGILFGAAAITALVGIGMTLESWRSWPGSQTFLPYQLRVWGWVDFAALPLAFSIFRWRKSQIPVAVAIALSIALPWCVQVRTQNYDYGTVHNTYTYVTPNLLAHALVAGVAVFLCWWGVRQASKALVNLGTAVFAMAVAWFYFSDLFDKMGRALGLIGLGILFLAGGWALEKARRRLLKGMETVEAAAGEAR